MNLNEKPIREKYKEFFGKNNEKMSELIEDGRIPMTVKQIIERRLNSELDDWKDNYFFTCDAIVYGKDGKFKIEKNSKKLLEMNKNTKLKNGAIPISQEYYESIDSPEFSEDDGDEVWKYLLEDLYDDYVKFLSFCSLICVNSESYVLRAWCVNRLEYGSYADGRGGLDLDGGRFVGIASEMLEEK